MIINEIKEKDNTKLLQHFVAEKFDGQTNTFIELHVWLPTKDGTGSCDIRLTNLRVIDRQGFVFDRAAGFDNPSDFFGKLEDRHFRGVPNIHRLVIVTHHEAIDAVDEIGDITKTPCLTAITKNGEGFSGKSLADDGGDDATIIQPHAWSVRIEDTDNFCVEVVIPMVGHGDGFGKAFGFVIDAPGADRVHVAPVVFILRVNEGVPIAL